MRHICSFLIRACFLLSPPLNSFMATFKFFFTIHRFFLSLLLVVLFFFCNVNFSGNFWIFLKLKLFNMPESYHVVLGPTHYLVILREFSIKITRFGPFQTH